MQVTWGGRLDTATEYAEEYKGPEEEKDTCGIPVSYASVKQEHLCQEALLPALLLTVRPFSGYSNAASPTAAFSDR